MNEDVDDALFTLFSHLRSRVECNAHVDPTGENMVLRCTTHEKADRELLKLAENGADRRVGGIGPFSLRSAFWPDSAHAAIGTVPGHFDRSAIGLLVRLTPESNDCGCWVGSSVILDT